MSPKGKTKMSIEDINIEIDKHEDKSEVSDGSHTFGELYEHRYVLYIQLCAFLHKDGASVWRSEKHDDGGGYEGWFLLGINKNKGEMMTYHLPLSEWEKCGFAETLERAPAFDGHTSDDVLKRINKL